VGVEAAISYHTDAAVPIDFNSTEQPIVLGSIMPSDYNTVTTVRVGRVVGTLPHIVGRVPTHPLTGR